MGNSKFSITNDLAFAGEQWTPTTGGTADKDCEHALTTGKFGTAIQTWIDNDLASAATPDLDACKTDCLNYLGSQCGAVYFKAPVGSGPATCRMYPASLKCDTKTPIDPVETGGMLVTQSGYTGTTIWIKCDISHWDNVKIFFVTLGLIAALASVIFVPLFGIGEIVGVTFTIGCVALAGAVHDTVENYAKPENGDTGSFVEQYDAANNDLMEYTMVSPNKKYTKGGTLRLYHDCHVLTNAGKSYTSKFRTSGEKEKTKAYSLKKDWGEVAGRRRRRRGMMLEQRRMSDNLEDSLEEAPGFWMDGQADAEWEQSATWLFNFHTGDNELEYNIINFLHPVAWKHIKDSGKACTSVSDRCYECAKCFDCLEPAHSGNHECDRCEASGCAECVEEIPCLVESSKDDDCGMSADQFTTCLDQCHQCSVTFMPDEGCSACDQCETALKKAAKCLAKIGKQPELYKSRSYSDSEAVAAPATTQREVKALERVLEVLEEKKERLEDRLDG